MRQKLSDLEIQRALGGLAGWARRGDALTKTFIFERFADGIAFVGRVAKAADEMDHHPDIDIRYTKVTMMLSTHDAGGITSSDLKLAERIRHDLTSSPSKTSWTMAVGCGTPAASARYSMSKNALE
jgi:4a-hydroxytetrahydrobiopterin dehydratase